MQSKTLDVIIIGAGPAGCSAAIYTGRAGLKTCVFGYLKESHVCRSHCIANYFGFSKPSKGADLLEEGQKQAADFGAKFIESEVVGVKMMANKKIEVIDSGGQQYFAAAVVICSGMGFKPSGIKGEKEFTGRGVSNCVTCDGFFFKNKNVTVIGNTNFAAEEALQLLSYTSKITIISHGKDFDFSSAMEEALKKNNIQTSKTVAVSEFMGKESLEKLKFKDGAEMTFDGAFLALGTATAADFARKLGIEPDVSQGNYIKINPRTGETNMKGVYAAGDCTGGNAQVAKSVGEGCNAGISVVKFIKGISSYVDYC